MHATESSQRAAIASILALLALALAHTFPSKVYPSYALATGSVLVLLALWGLAVCWTNRVACNPIALGAATLWLLWSLVGVARMQVPTAGLDTLSRLFIGYAAFVVGLSWASIGQMQTEDQSGNGVLNRIIPGLAFILLALSLHAAWQRFFGYDASLQQMRENPSAFGEDIIMRDAIMHALKLRAPGSTFGDQNTLAALSSLGIGLFAGWAAVRPSAKRLILGGIGVAACAFAVLLTQSRGGALTAILAVGGGTGLLLLGFRERGLSTHKIRQVAYGIIAVVLIGAAILAVALAFSSLGAEWRRRLAAVSTGTQRIYYARSALSIWSEAPWTGNGPGAFALFYPQHRIQGAGETSDPHNWVLRILAEQGIIGLALSFGWLASTLFRRTKNIAALTCVLGVLLLLFNGLLQHGFSTREVYLDFALLLGLAAGVIAIDRPFKLVISRIWLAIGFLCIVGLAWPWWIKPDQVRVYLERSKMAMSEASALRSEGLHQDAFRQVQYAQRQAESALRLSPNNPWTHDFLAVLLFYTPGIQNPSKGIELEQQAIRLNPYSASFHDSLAQMYRALGRHDEAFAEWEKAIALHPLDEVLYANRSRAWEQQGNLQAALDDAYRAAKLTMRSPDRYWAEYKRLIEKTGKKSSLED